MRLAPKPNMPAAAVATVVAAAASAAVAGVASVEVAAVVVAAAGNLQLSKWAVGEVRGSWRMACARSSKLPLAHRKQGHALALMPFCLGM
jgi:hypothetical protein